MGKKSKATAHPAPSEDLNGHMEAGEAHLAEGRLTEALQCFSAAVAAGPTRQLAWYNQGIAAAELWQESQELEGTGQQLLETAIAAFRKILELDTSRRSELRYLGTIAAGRLLVAAAERSDELGTSHCDALLVEATRHFEEAHRLVREWGHDDLGDAWGDWGKVLALQMRRYISSIPSIGSQSQSLNWSDLLQRVSTLCNQASERFQAATEAVGEGEDEEMEDRSTSDLDRMVLHIEHLSAFVSLASRGVTEAPGAESLEWLRRGILAFQEAVRLAFAVVDLADSADWQHKALQGDVFAAGYHLLCAARPQHQLVAEAPETWRSGLFGSQGMLMPSPPISGESAPAQAQPQPVEVTAEDLVRLAEEAYGRALAAPGVDRGEVGLSCGELALSLARRALADGRDATSALQGAATSLQLAARFGTREEKATAWYNLACAAALAERPSKASEALRACLELVSPAARKDWLREASEDQDLKHLVSSPDWSRATGGY